MDHLLNFGYANPIRVPYECEQIFHGSFLEYPGKRGWDKQKLLHRDLQGKTEQQARSFLQEWLYFGLLHSFLDIPELDFHHDDFVIDSEDRKWISTAKLASYLSRYRAMLDAARTTLSPEEQGQKKRYIAECLQTHHTFALEYCKRETDAARFGPVPHIWPMTPELSLSIGLLATALFLTSAGWNGVALSWKDCAWGVKDKMVELGWCPSQVSELAAVDDLYTAYTLGPPVDLADHVGKQCGSRICNVNQLEHSTYETKHVMDNCKCDFKGPPVDEVVERLRRGLIPTIRVHKSDDGLDVLLAENMDHKDSNVTYVAISHIWSDGLGNPLQNALPTCQLRRLQNLVNAVSGSNAPGAWWCDTLCVPVNSLLWRDRRLAIQKIEDVFKKADYTLALDRSLLHIPCNCDPLELFLRLRLSNWMRRVWTLSEATMANTESTWTTTISVQLDGCVRDVQTIQNDVKSRERNSIRAIYSTYSFLPTIGLLPLLPRDEVQQKPRHFQVFETWKAIHRRPTSRQRDERICMASILSIANVDKLLELDSYDYSGKMMWFLQTAGSVIMDILFQPRERLSVVGFRRAPRSFLSYFGDADWDKGSFFEPGFIGPNKRGCLFRRQGLRVEKGQLSLPLIEKNVLISYDQGGNKFFLRYFGSEGELAAARNSTIVDGSHHLQKPAIIFGHNIFKKERTMGILVDIFEESADGRIACFYIVGVGVIPAAHRQGDATFQELEAKILPKTQEWLVM